jgi:UTP:GlnB (protein PII) uridylyltransferase
MSVASEQVLAFLSDFSRWAASEPDILAVALVGSHARDEAMDGSDVDLVIVAREPKSYLEDTVGATLWNNRPPADRAVWQGHFPARLVCGQSRS